jgi:hypothetical protein
LLKKEVIYKEDLEKILGTRTAAPQADLDQDKFLNPVS